MGECTHRPIVRHMIERAWIALCAIVPALLIGATAEAQGRLSHALDQAAGHSSSTQATPSSSSTSSSSSWSSTSYTDYSCPNYSNPNCPSAWTPSVSSDSAPDPNFALAKRRPRSPPPRPYGYAAYPYASDAVPYLLLGKPGNMWVHDQDHHPVRQVAGQLSADTGYALGIVHGYVRGLVLTPSIAEVSVAARWMYEHAVRHAAVLIGTDVGLRVLQERSVFATLFLGLRYFGDSERGYGGVAGGLRVDMFVSKPILLSAAVDAGVLGETYVVDARTQLGFMLGAVELYAGGELLWIGEVALHRPLVGVRAWL